MTVPATKVQEFAAQGYTIARGLFSPEEVDHLREHFFWVNREHRRQSDNITVAKAIRSPYTRASCSRIAGTKPACNG